MNMNPQQGDSRMERLKNAIGWIAFISGTLAVSVEVFLHRRLGARYLGLQAAAVILLVPLYSLFWEGHDVAPLAQFLAVYLVMCFFHRIGNAARSRRGGAQEHTRYTGYPRLMRLLPRTSERTVKLVIEPIIVFLVGTFTLPASEPLGSYLMLASAGLIVSTHLSAGYERTRALDMHDASIDQRQLAEDFHGMRGERR